MTNHDATGPERLPATRNWRSYAWPALRLLITVGILGVIGLRVDMHTLAESMRSVSLPLFALALAILILSPLLGGVRWWIVLNAMGRPARLGPVTAIFWIGTALSQVLPNVAAEGVKVWIAKRRGIEVETAIQSVLFERLAMILALLFLVVATERLVAARIGSYGPLWMAPLLLACGILGLALLAFSDRIARRLGDWGLLRFVSRLSALTRKILSSRWALPLFLACLLSHLVLIVVAWKLGEALRMPLAFPDYLAFIPMTIVAMVIPVSINGWGVREGLLIVLFGAVKIDTPVALAFSVLYGLLMILVSLPGLVAWCAGSDRRALHDEHELDSRHQPAEALFQDLGRPE